MKVESATTKINVLAVVLVACAIVVGILAVARLDTTGKRGSGLSKEYTYDVKDLAKIDPNLILYEEASEPVATGFRESRAIAIGPAGAVCVAGDKAVRLFDKNGRLLHEISLDDMPRCLTVADDGAIYLGMKDHVEVYKGAYQGEAKKVGVWESLGDEAVLTSIAVYRENVFVADAGNRVVLRYDTAGNLINRIGEKDENRNIPGFVIPSPYFDLAVAGDGLLRVTDPGRHLVQAYTFDGDLEFSWGEFSSAVQGFCGCCNPVNFAILEDESFVTVEKGLIRAKVYDADGAFVGVVAGPDQLLEEGASRVCTTAAECQAGGFDVAVDTEGRVFVLDTIKNIVRVFAKGKHK